MRENTEADFSVALMFDLAHASLRTCISVDRMTVIDRHTKYQYKDDCLRKTAALNATHRGLSYKLDP